MPLTLWGLIWLLVPSAVALLEIRLSLPGWLPPSLFAALVLIICLDHWWSQRHSMLQLERRLQPKFSLGIENRVAINVYNRSAFPLTLYVKDDPPAEFVTAQREFFLRLAPYQTTSHTYYTKPRARGRYLFGDLHVRGRSRLGLSFWQRRYPARAEIAVYPNLLQLQRYQLLARADRLSLGGFRLSRYLGQGTEFESLREYSPDDDFRQIDWKATARRHYPISRQYEAARSQTVLLLLDAGRLMSTLIGDLTRLDYAVNAALMLGFVALECGDAVGLLAFADELRAYVPPGKGRRQWRLLLDALYELQPALVEPDYAHAFSWLAARARKRALIVCFTDVVDVEASARLLGHLAALAPHHLPLLVTLRDLELQRMAQARPRDILAVYKRALAADLLYEREQALAALRQRGGLVLDAPPAELSVAAVNQYLRLKARGRL